MIDPSQKTVDNAVEESIDLFRRAKVGDVAPVEPFQPQNVLLVLDGSNQDETAAALAGHLVQRFGSRLSVVDAREGAESNEAAQKTAAAWKATPLAKPSGDSFQQILDAIDASQCDAAVLPCPYGRDLDTIGADSTGTVIDVLLARSPVPLLVVRRPYVPGKDVFSRVLLVLIGENEAAAKAASWATGLVALSGRFELMLLLEEEFYENVRALMQKIDPDLEVSPESISHALEQTHVRLHRGLQKASETGTFHYAMHTLRDHTPAADALDDEAGHPLLVLPLERGDHSSEGHVHDHIRNTPNPLLIVPWGEPQK